jgi:phosphoribosyl 1,2-cyclic phosphodiesterase
MKKFCVLGSGSKGNCTFVENDGTRILIDAGLTAKQIELRLKSIGVRPESIEAICFTHNHVDHWLGGRVFAEKHGTHLYANLETMQEIIDSDATFESMEWTAFDTEEPFEIGNIQVDSFPVSHDAAEPVGFILTLNEAMIGICTDLGIVSDSVYEALNECDVILLESNHDPKLLAASDRPEANKKRIAGRFGHLTNRESARFAVRLAKTGKLKRLYLGHLSEECNKPHLAKNAIQWEFRKNGVKGIGIYMTHQKKRSVQWNEGGEPVYSVGKMGISENSIGNEKAEPAAEKAVEPEISEKGILEKVWDWIFDDSDGEEEVV